MTTHHAGPRPFRILAHPRWRLFLAGPLLLIAASLACSCSSSAQSVPQPSSPAPAVQGQLATSAQLDELLAPVALYPDPLLSVLLPASTVPFDLVMAARFVRGGGDPARINEQPWDASVKALAHYPDVLKWMDDNLEWTKAVGDAFRDQPEDVMKSVQQLRAEARSAGNLSTSKEQVVVVDGGYIRIVPGSPDIIYVPLYDPDVIYVERVHGYGGPMFGFSIGWAVGPWLIYDCDWEYHRLWIRDWRPGWTYRWGWQRPWRWDTDRHDYRGRDDWHDEHRWERDLPHPRVVSGTPDVPKPPVPPHNTRGEGTRKGAIVDPLPTPRGAATGWGTAPRGATRETTPTRVQSAPGQTRVPTAPPIPVEPKRGGSIFGGYQRGSDARDASNRGTISRQAPVAAPQRAPAPPVRTNTPPPQPRNTEPANNRRPK